MRIHDLYDQFPALCGDSAFPQLAIIVARYSTSQSDESRISLRMSSVSESIEYFLRFIHKHLNCFQYHTVFMFYLEEYESPSNITICPPILEDYLPLGQILRQAPDVTDDSL